MKRLLYISAIIVSGFAVFSCSNKEPDIPTPKLTFTEKVDADFESAILSCTISGNMTAEKLSIEYSKDQSLSGAIKKTMEKEGDKFSLIIDGLEIQTMYYYRYTVENKASSLVDEKIRSFKTLDYAAPIVTTGDVKNISGTKATLEGKVEFSCGKNVTAQGFKFGKDRNNLLDKQVDLAGFSVLIEGLEFETSYYYQAYATSEIGTGYGEVKEFKTSNAVSFKAIEFKEITASSVTISGGVLDSGGVQVDKQGFKYSEDGTEQVVFVESDGNASIDNLKRAATYNIWFYAKTFEGEFESEKMEFKTSSGIATLGTLSVTNIGMTSAVLSCEVMADGSSTITTRGFCYSTAENPTTDSETVSVQGTVGPMQVTLNNLEPGTKYFVRAFAITKYGTSYSDDASFTTLTKTAYHFLTFRSTGTSTLSLNVHPALSPVLYYSYDSFNWETWDYSELSFTSNNPIYICGSNPTSFSLSHDVICKFVVDGSDYYCDGDIMSLINRDEIVTSIPSERCFSGLFSGCSGLVSAPELSATTLTPGCYESMFLGCKKLLKAPDLPATTLSDDCYNGMFMMCSALEDAPQLPATILAKRCYYDMFEFCYSLTTIPILPATNLEEECYLGMFMWCTSLEIAPTLPAKKLAKNCYQHMFYACEKLKYIKCLATDISEEDCTFSWVQGVSSTGTFVKNASMESWKYGISGIPNSDWVVENE